MPTFDGDTPADRKLWHSYVYWARERASMSASAVPARGAIVDDAGNRVDATISKALHAILFTSFALEYRLKRVLISMNVPFCQKETFGPFLNKFWGRLASVTRLDGQGSCLPPSDWLTIEPDLKRLVKLRNHIAHANYTDTLQFLSQTSSPTEQVRDLYNAAIQAIRLVNEGTGYDTRSRKELDEYFEPLKVS